MVNVKPFARYTPMANSTDTPVSNIDRRRVNSLNEGLSFSCATSGGPSTHRFSASLTITFDPHLVLLMALDTMLRPPLLLLGSPFIYIDEAIFSVFFLVQSTIKTSSCKNFWSALIVVFETSPTLLARVDRKSVV